MGIEFRGVVGVVFVFFILTLCFTTLLVFDPSICREKGICQFQPRPSRASAASDTRTEAGPLLLAVSLPSQARIHSVVLSSLLSMRLRALSSWCGRVQRRRTFLSRARTFRQPARAR